MGFGSRTTKIQRGHGWDTLVFIKVYIQPRLSSGLSRHHYACLTLELNRSDSRTGSEDQERHSRGGGQQRING